jgi:aerobic carbon-monoxide dehydrogenase small subunit
MTMLSMIVNGRSEDVDIGADDTLVHVLRDRLGLIGTKVGCGEGECGACTVIVDGQAVCACLYPAMKAHGRHVETIEGLKDGSKLHALQQAFVDANGAQCGYCSPGFIMSAKALLDRNPRPTRAEIVEAIAGNICRCTGYYQIVDAIELAASRLSGSVDGPRVADVGRGMIR